MAQARLWIVALLMAAAVGCGGDRAAESEPQEYPIHGQIIELKPADRVAIIEHEEIPGWMGAMRMGFPIRDGEDFEALAEGDWIDGTVYVNGFEYAVGGIRVVDPPAEEPAATEEPQP